MEFDRLDYSEYLCFLRKTPDSLNLSMTSRGRARRGATRSEALRIILISKYKSLIIMSDV